MNHACHAISTAQTCGDDRDEPGPSPERSLDADPDNPPEAAPGHVDPTGVEIIGEAVLTRGIDAAWLRDRILDLIPHLARPFGALRVRLLDDEAMATLHQRHCGIDGPTDVLTFLHDDDAELLEVDLALGMDEARRRSKELGHHIERELLLYVVHGLLHCAGFDDHEEDDATRMHKEEDRLLEAIGVGRTFHPGPSGHDDARLTKSRDRGMQD